MSVGLTNEMFPKMYMLYTFCLVTVIQQLSAITAISVGIVKN